MALEYLTHRQNKALEELEAKGEVPICFDFAEPTLQALVDHGLAHWRYPGKGKPKVLSKKRIQPTIPPDEPAERAADRAATNSERSMP